MAGSKGRRIASIKESKEIPNGSNFVVELPNGGNTRRVTKQTLNREMYEGMQYGTDEDVDAIIAGTYEDPAEDNWGDEPDSGEEPGGGTPSVPGDVATDQEVQDYIESLDIFKD